MTDSVRSAAKSRRHWGSSQFSRASLFAASMIARRLALSSWVLPKESTIFLTSLMIGLLLSEGEAGLDEARRGVDLLDAQPGGAAGLRVRGAVREPPLAR